MKIRYQDRWWKVNYKDDYEGKPLCNSCGKKPVVYLCRLRHEADVSPGSGQDMRLWIDDHFVAVKLGENNTCLMSDCTNYPDWIMTRKTVNPNNKSLYTHWGYCDLHSSLSMFKRLCRM